jgi:hypothetical protein
MSSVLPIGHPTKWLTNERKRTDIVEGILLGGNQTKKLNAKNGQEDHSSERMIQKLTITAENSSDPLTRIKARHVIQLLQGLPSTSNLVSETQRRAFLNSANTIKLEVPSKKKRKKKPQKEEV